MVGVTDEGCEKTINFHIISPFKPPTTLYSNCPEFQGASVNLWNFQGNFHWRFVINDFLSLLFYVTRVHLVSYYEYWRLLAILLIYVFGRFSSENLTVFCLLWSMHLLFVWFKPEEQSTGGYLPASWFCWQILLLCCPCLVNHISIQSTLAVTMYGLQVVACKPIRYLSNTVLTTNKNFTWLHTFSIVTTKL